MVDTVKFLADVKFVGRVIAVINKFVNVTKGIHSVWLCLIDCANHLNGSINCSTNSNNCRDTNIISTPILTN